MNILVSEQLNIFGWAIVFGISIGLFYDFIRIFRRIIPHRRFLIGFEDLVFWLITGIAVFGYIFNSTDGIIRGFIFIGLSLGILLYYLILSNLIVSKITYFLKQLMKLFTPITKSISQVHYKNKKHLKKFRKWLIIKIKNFLKEIKYIIKKI